MSNKDIWIVFTKSKVLIESPLAMDDSEFIFGEVFIPSVTIEEAIIGARQALLDLKLVMNDISKCIRHQENEWCDNSDMSKEINESVEKASRLNKIVYGIFRSTEELDLEEY